MFCDCGITLGVIGRLWSVTVAITLGIIGRLCSVTVVLLLVSLVGYVL